MPRRALLEILVHLPASEERCWSPVQVSAAPAMPETEAEATQVLDRTRALPESTFLRLY